jgi:chorismate mutase/prephenate dehydratase
MHQMLSPLAANGVTMTRFESRPARTGLWEYAFYVDIEGHERDPCVTKALGEMRGLVTFLKVLGSYPAAAA